MKAIYFVTLDESFFFPHISVYPIQEEMEVNIEPLPLDIGRVSSALHPKPVVCQNTSAS